MALCQHTICTTAQLGSVVLSSTYHDVSHINMKCHKYYQDVHNFYSKSVEMNQLIGSTLTNRTTISLFETNDQLTISMQRAALDQIQCRNSIPSRRRIRSRDRQLSDIEMGVVEGRLGIHAVRDEEPVTDQAHHGPVGLHHGPRSVRAHGQSVSAGVALFLVRHQRRVDALGI